MGVCRNNFLSFRGFITTFQDDPFACTLNPNSWRWMDGSNDFPFQVVFNDFIKMEIS